MCTSPSLEGHPNLTQEQISHWEQGCERLSGKARFRLVNNVLPSYTRDLQNGFGRNSEAVSLFLAQFQWAACTVAKRGRTFCISDRIRTNQI